MLDHGPGHTHLPVREHLPEGTWSHIPQCYSYIRIAFVTKSITERAPVSGLSHELSTTLTHTVVFVVANADFVTCDSHGVMLDLLITLASDDIKSKMAEFL